MYKTLGVILIVLALVIGIVPQFTDCLSQGRTLKTVDGKMVPMKCHWTSIAEIGAAVPLALVGVFHLTSKRRETKRSVALFGLTLGALAVLFPTVLIGVCSNPDMMCNMVEKPVLILAGTLAMAASLVGMVLPSTRMEVELA